MTRDPIRALQRASRLLRIVDTNSPARPPILDADGRALICPASGRRIPVIDGVIDFLGDDFEPNFGQTLLDSEPSARIYDWVRPHLAPLLGMPKFATEVQNVIERLELARGETVVDVACGHGNFTLELARHVGPDGLVIGIDIAGAMLRRAVAHLREADLDNVAWVRADALDLPLVDACVSRVNCSGGLHQFPDRRRALDEVARITKPKGRLTISGFASSSRAPVAGFRRWAQRGDLNFVPMDELERDMQAAGYDAVGGEMSGRWVGYRWGTRC